MHEPTNKQRCKTDFFITQLASRLLIWINFVPFFPDRIIMAIWKMRSLSPEQQGDMIEKESDTKELQLEEGGTLFTHEDVKMSEIFSSALSVDVSVFTFASSCLSLTRCVFATYNLFWAPYEWMFAFTGRVPDGDVFRRAFGTQNDAKSWLYWLLANRMGTCKPKYIPAANQLQVWQKLVKIWRRSNHHSAEVCPSEPRRLGHWRGDEPTRCSIGGLLQCKMSLHASLTLRGNFLIQNLSRFWSYGVGNIIWVRHHQLVFSLNCSCLTSP